MGLSRPPKKKENDLLMYITIGIMLIGLGLFFAKLVSITL